MSIISGAQALTEDTTRVQNVIAGCVEASALVVAHIIKGTPLNTTQLRNLIIGAQAAQVADIPGGAQGNKGLLWDLSQFNIDATIYPRGSAQDLQDIIEKALSNNTPVLIGTNFGAALTGEPSGLRGHEIVIVGESTPGNYIVADPNTIESGTGGFVTDTLQQLVNAGAQAVVPKRGNVLGGTIGRTDNSGNNPITGTTLADKSGNGLPDWFNWLVNIFSGTTAGSQNPLPSQQDIIDLGWKALFILVGLILIIIGLNSFAKLSDQPTIIPVPV